MNDRSAHDTTTHPPGRPSDGHRETVQASSGSSPISPRRHCGLGGLARRFAMVGLVVTLLNDESSPHPLPMTDARDVPASWNSGRRATGPGDLDDGLARGGRRLSAPGRHRGSGMPGRSIRRLPAEGISRGPRSLHPAIEHGTDGVDRSWRSIPTTTGMANDRSVSWVACSDGRVVVPGFGDRRGRISAIDRGTTVEARPTRNLVRSLAELSEANNELEIRGDLEERNRELDGRIGRRRRHDLARASSSPT